MAKYFIRRGGKKEAFRPEKIKRSIRNAARDAHLSAKAVKTLVSKASRPVLKFAAKRKVVKAAVVRKKVLSQLDKLAPAVAKSWRGYERRRRARRRR